MSATNGMIGSGDLFLATLPPTRAVRRLVFWAWLACLAAFLAAVPFAKTPLPRAPGFIAVYEALLIVTELITAILLVGQLTMLRSSALLVLAGGYLFTALMAASHMATFPGLFSAGGLLGAGPQTTAWLYNLWHIGFPVFVIGYGVLKGGIGRQEHRRVDRRTMIAAFLCVVVVALGFDVLATAGSGLLPPIMQGDGYAPALIFVTCCTWCVTLLAGAFLWFRKPHTVLDLCLVVVVSAWAADIGLGAVFNAGRYDLGFFLGRLYGLLASSFVLVMLIAENLVLYQRVIAANRILTDLASHDGLTGILNRRALDSHLREELSRMQRLQQVLSVLMIDLDNFKNFNDTYGHLDGDQCLREIAQVLVTTINRPGDAAGRFGGEEFLVILPATQAKGAEHVAERLRRAVSNLAIPHQGTAAGVVTVSIGVSTIRPHAGTTIDDAIAGADAALYRAKAAGRNRVVFEPASSSAWVA